ncbi:hypothetical protein VHAB30_21260 [Variovorax boronicumulans]|nr:hypothetical protein VHAB30_21260 [Variovorax boronicumulans]
MHPPETGAAERQDGQGHEQEEREEEAAHESEEKTEEEKRAGKQMDTGPRERPAPSLRRGIPAAPKEQARP